MVIDPVDGNTAIDTEGALLYAVRAGTLKNPDAPTLAELNAMPIVGYGNWNLGGTDEA